MKCDVCLTKIPIGETKCPNCGYTMKKVNASSYDTNSLSYEHIKTNDKTLKSRIKDDHPIMKQHKTIVNGKSNSKLVSKIMTFILSLIIFIGAVGILLYSIISDNTDDYNNQISDLTFQEVIDQGLADSTVDKAYEYENDLLNFLFNNDFENVESEEKVSQYDDEYSTKMSMSAQRNDIYYYINVTHENKELKSVNLCVAGKYDKDTNIKNFNLKEDDIKDISEYLELDDLYSILNNGHSLMNKEDDERYVYSSYNDDFNIYMSEEYKNYSTPYYSFYYSYDVDK